MTRAIPIAAASLLLASTTPTLTAQEDGTPHARWEGDIAKFEAADEAAGSLDTGFLFTGSSSVRMWKLDESFPGLGAVNRGFGGSEIADSTHFAERYIFPRKPHTVLIYAGDNDIAKGKTAQRVIADFRAFVAKVHAELPAAHIGYIAIKPSIARWDMWPRMKAANDGIAEICAGDELLTFLDIAPATLDESGEPDPALFVKDGLHLNDAGYAAWTEVIKPFIDTRSAATAAKPATP